MTTDGGNWMLVWKAAYNTYGTNSFSYDVGTLANLDFTDAAMAYVNPETMEKTNFTSMSGAQMVADFKAQHPLSYWGRDVTVTAKIGTYTQSGVVLKYGWANFPTYIYEGWHNNSTSYGRIGINWNQASPFYTGFTRGAGNYCNVGYQHYYAQVCSNTRRFSLWVR